MYGVEQLRPGGISNAYHSLGLAARIGLEACALGASRVRFDIGHERSRAREQRLSSEKASAPMVQYDSN